MKQKLIKPTKVLCKKTCTSGEDYWWDDEGSVSPPNHPKRHPRENRMHVKGEWYDVVFNENDSWTKDKKTFTILDKMGKNHLFFMYSEDDRKNFPDHCDVYGVRDYAKWFYTPEELILLEKGEFKESYKITNDVRVQLGNYHWVMLNGTWVIAKCSGISPEHGKHWWTIIGDEIDKTDDYFEEIGEQVESKDTQEKNKKTIERLEELNDAIFPMLDSWKKEGTEDAQWCAPIEYHKPFVFAAAEKNSTKMWAEFADSPFFGKAEKL